MSSFLLEAPIFNVQSGLDAARLGIHRLELCANFPEGGETPSAGMLKFLKSELDIPVFVMIRPRGGDFCYSQKELMVMKRDIELLGELGADGFVFGVLDTQGRVNQEACEALVRTASGRPCTFHRAFDACRDQAEALDPIIQSGFKRILTSGAKNSIDEGIDQIEFLFEKAKDKIIIMPGGGAKPEHVFRFKNSPYFSEIHASCKTWIPSPNQFINPHLQFSSDPKTFSHHLGIDPSTVNQFLEALG
ncbi:copper homeostasis protein CutC [Algoriphagus hitonicola]|uniref:PF03932 family protein CutC n=1 Tax=Algoriphagus hitonicola TaxID=435880 RepID=A0A1I2NCZ2_9BACT|nr:copper homeostasis protein CutC [Algoriphagus hitonicola]SFG01408.1 copper homeostasis protein [Algoriphagus hitonicola]